MFCRLCKAQGLAAHDKAAAMLKQGHCCSAPTFPITVSGGTLARPRIRVVELHDAPQGAVSIGYTMPARDPEHGFLFPAPGARDERYLEATGAAGNSLPDPNLLPQRPFACLQSNLPPILQTCACESCTSSRRFSSGACLLRHGVLYW